MTRERGGQGTGGGEGEEGAGGGDQNCPSSDLQIQVNFSNFEFVNFFYFFKI